MRLVLIIILMFFIEYEVESILSTLTEINDNIETLISLERGAK